MRSRMLLSLLFIVLFTSAHAQILGTRLISLVNYDFEPPSAFVPTDSTTYHYQGIKTSDMRTGIYNYDSSLTYLYSSSAYHKFKLYLKGFFPFDSVSSYAEKIWVDSNSSWANSNIVASNFDGSNLVTNRNIINYATTPPSISDMFYTYDASKNIIQILKAGALPTDSTKILYAYDVSNNLTSTITQQFVLLPPPAGWQDNNKTENYFNSLNEDTLQIYASWDPVLLFWMINGTTRHYYDAGKKVVSSYYNSFYITSGITPSGRDSVVYDTAKNVVSITNQSYDTSTHVYTNHKLTTWTFDTGSYRHNPLVMTTFSWSGSAWVTLVGQDNKTIYHYQEYTNAIPNVNMAVSKFELYPVPAQNMINVSIQWKIPQPFTIAIYDMQGRLMQQTGEQAITNFQRSLFIADLASGSYIMQVSGRNSNIAQQFTVSK